MKPLSHLVKVIEKMFCPLSNFRELCVKNVIIIIFRFAYLFERIIEGGEGETHRSLSVSSIPWWLQ